jgi:hypothetical protein
MAERKRALCWPQLHAAVGPPGHGPAVVGVEVKQVPWFGKEAAAAHTTPARSCKACGSGTRSGSRLRRDTCRHAHCGCEYQRHMRPDKSMPRLEVLPQPATSTRSHSHSPQLIHSFTHSLTHSPCSRPVACSMNLVMPTSSVGSHWSRRWSWSALYEGHGRWPHECEMHRREVVCTKTHVCVHAFTALARRSRA